jgi:glycosyltransferase involved in cell wall biosynthesis
VIVVDDGSRDGSLAAARALPGVTVIAQAQAGAAAARNRGVAATHGTHLAFLDADDVWVPGALAGLLATLEAHPAAHLASGRVELFADASYDRPFAPLPPDVQGQLFGSFLLRRHDFLRVGPFDATLRAGELLDWVARARAAGLQRVDLDRVVLRRRVHARNNVHDRSLLARSYAQALRAKRARERSSDGR